MRTLRDSVARTAAAVLAASVITGCSSEPAPDGPEGTGPAESAHDADDADDDQAGETSGEDAGDPGPADVADDQDASGGDAVELVGLILELDLEERVADGSTMRLTRLEITETAVLVDVELIVAAERSNVWLNNQLSTPALLRDDSGGEYLLIPPDGNRSLRVGGGEQLEGTLSFQGPLQRGVETLQLVLNEDSDPEQANMNDQRLPYFVFPPVGLTDGGAP